MTPKIENIQPNRRNCQNELKRASSPVCRLKSGSVESTLRISCRIAPVIAPRREPEVADDADDGEPFALRIIEQTESLADDIGPVRPETLRERAVDECDRRSRLAFGVGEIAAGDERKVERLQQVRRDAVIRRARLLSWRDGHAFRNHAAF